MENNNNDNNKKKSLKPNFDKLNNPKEFRKHMEEIKKAEIELHDRILNKLLDQFEPIDFESIANPRGEDKFKVSNKHYSVISIENVLRLAKKNKWGLCKNHDFIYLYNGSYWSDINKESFQKFLGKAAEKMGVPKFTAKYYKFRKELFEQFLATAYLEPKTSDPDCVLINLNNGTFEINSNGTQLKQFNQDDFITYKLPFNYNTEAKAPLFQKYLDEVLPDVESQRILCEFVGYIFIKNNNTRIKEEKALILYGTGANGKSVFFQVISALLGEVNISNYSLQSLTNETGYYRAKIANKLVNYASEINAKLQSSIFKQLVSGEPVEARLPYGQPFILKEYARLIFNCNELPKEVEQTNAYFRRFLIIPFSVTIPPEKQDKNLHTKIIDNELSGVFNWVQDGLNRLLEQKRFSNCEASIKAIKEYQKESDSVIMFIEESGYKSSINEKVTIKELYQEYKAFCMDDGYRAVKKTNFIKRLRTQKISVEKSTGNKLYAFVDKEIDEDLSC